MGSFALSLSALLCIASVLSSYGIVGVEGYIKYDTGSGIVDGKLNVHLVAHSHDDVGWLKTIDQYYVGSNNSIQGACVENILDSVVMALRRDPNRKFIFAEMAFFSRWWEEQSVDIQQEVTKLVDAGRLEFVNGGWCMHDEATTHYIDMIDQTTLGHQLIKSQFNKTPRAGWQIDPFGHSAVQAYLLGAEIFANAFPVHYSPPDGFHFEVNDDFNPVQDNPLLFDFNVELRVNDFIAAAMIQANVTRSNHIMWTMGDDFQYQYAESWFKQMDKLIHYVNKAARQLEYLMGRGSTSNANTDGLGNALGIAQHHDAVTGTAKQHTTNDYAKRLAIGASEVNDHNLVVKDSTGEVVESQYVEVDSVTRKLRKFYVEAYTGTSDKHTTKYWLVFAASVPPLGWNTYFISKESKRGNRRHVSMMDLPKKETIEIGPGNLKLSFSSSSGQLKRMFNSKTGIIRVYRDKDHAEVEFTVGISCVLPVRLLIGPIPTDDDIGKEVIARLTANMVTDKVFYTDSNARDFLKRVRDYRADWPLTVTQPVAGNYYPINLGIYIEDNKSEFSVLVDRPPEDPASMMEKLS
ncbi:UNVERIFIED_CONTAM: Alpha-mannosidase [Sesamum latifolium]|uniref:Alpha-mannosidase n=1 Tax=Sesamum latifolium TaxID=2727402 RepID=A0AAW2X918_9LAMI